MHLFLDHRTLDDGYELKFQYQKKMFAVDN